MDANTLLLIVVIVLAVVAIIGFFMYRQKGSVSITGPGGTGLKFDGSSEPTPDRPAIETGDIKAGKNAKILDETQGGIKTAAIEAGEDVDIQAKIRPQPSDPKAPPPA